MVRGARVAVTRVPGRYQCAETATIARGRGRARPRAAQASVYALRWIAFIGLPCPKKKAGMAGAGRGALILSQTTRGGGTQAPRREFRRWTENASGGCGPEPRSGACARAWL